MENATFEGGSPEVRGAAGLGKLDKIYPDRKITAPYDKTNPYHKQFIGHAEEDAIAQFEEAVAKAKLSPDEVKGTLQIHQSNSDGICNKCTLGLFTDHKLGKEGIFKQLTKKYPNLTIKATTEIDYDLKFPRDTISFEVKNGEILDCVQIRKNPKNPFQFTEYPK